MDEDDDNYFKLCPDDSFQMGTIFEEEDGQGRTDTLVDRKTDGTDMMDYSAGNSEDIRIKELVDSSDNSVGGDGRRQFEITIEDFDTLERRALSNDLGADLSGEAMRGDYSPIVEAEENLPVPVPAPAVESDGIENIDFDK